MNARDFTTLFRVALRRQRFAFAAWAGSFYLILALLPKAYQKNLGSMEFRRSVIEMMNSNGATRLLFGTIPQPGTIGQAIQWESGMIIMVLTAVAALLIVTTAGRRGEDDGLRELVEGTGVSRATVFAVQAAMGTAFSAVAGAGCGFVLAVQAPLFSEVSVTGSVCLGVAIFLVGCAFSAVALVASQLADDAVGARRLSLLVLFLAFAVKMAAESSEQRWLQWLTPLGWKEPLHPFTDDRLVLAIPMAAIVGAFSALAWRLYAGRELHGAYLRSARRSKARLRAKSVFSLSLRLGRRRLTGWLAGVVAMAALVGSMAGSFVTLTKKNSNYSDLVGKMGAGGDVTEKIVSIFSIIVGILVMCEAVSAMASLAETEKRGILDVELASGASRRSVLAGQAAAAAVESAILSAAGAAALAVTVGASLDWTSGREAAWRTVTQWPAAVFAIGFGSLLYAASRRLTAAAWAAVGWSFALSWFGGILNLPKWMLDSTLLGWSFSPGHVEHVPQAVGLLAFGVAGSAVAAFLAYRRRDVLAG